MVGKSKEPWLQQALAEYEKRLTPVLQLSWIHVSDDEELLKALQREISWIALDPKGELVDSLQLSKQLYRLFLQQGSRLTFVLGGPEGLPAKIVKEALWRWSLSPLTFTHQIARLILVEQIYRAFEINKGSKYHK